MLHISLLYAVDFPPTLAKFLSSLGFILRSSEIFRTEEKYEHRREIRQRIGGLSFPVTVHSWLSICYVPVHISFKPPTSYPKHSLVFVIAYNCSQRHNNIFLQPIFSWFMEICVVATSHFDSDFHILYLKTTVRTFSLSEHTGLLSFLFHSFSWQPSSMQARSQDFLGLVSYLLTMEVPALRTM